MVMFPILVAFGVATEVIVIVEDQDACVRPKPLAILICRRQTADAPANDHELVVLVEVDGIVESDTFASKGVRRFERTRM
jgi:hypothetical protein